MASTSLLSGDAAMALTSLVVLMLCSSTIRDARAIVVFTHTLLQAFTQEHDFM